MDTDSPVGIDGIRVGSKFCRRGKSYPVVNDLVRTSETSCRNFLFSPLQFTDDDQLLDASSVQGLGEIRLSIYKATIRKTIPSVPKSARELARKSIIYERLKNGLVHSIRFVQFSAPSYGLKRLARLASLQK
ncbi:hypothetical protein BDQ17DRAFT_625480 [Cyathus striatus]|nr:hypothetical protein BDQ17DRAFT_625480 [Cyathus striatus]